MDKILIASLFIAWATWALAFFVRRARGTGTRAATAKVSRVGIALQGVGFAIVWLTGRRGPSDVAPWRIGVFFLCVAAALALVWTAIPALGKQWQFQAAVNVDHELIQTGPYRFLRHPIYTSMLAMLIATAALITSLWPFLVATTIFIAGMEIRIQAEDRLLSERFGERFAEYRKRVPAYLPFLR